MRARVFLSYGEANDASVKEMEAAGIAHVATMFGVPLVAVKAITDIVDGDKPTPDEFMENLGRVRGGEGLFEGGLMEGGVGGWGRG